ncbi:MAG TPA: cytochrome d ubiquinol oxidase subunit II [Gaiellaceae bacterium]
MDLQILWFVLVAFFWSGYFVLEGFDFGVGMLLPFLPRDERERGAMFESIGPVWDANEVWLVVAGAAIFAAFPAWYAAAFSSLYLALLLVLFFLIIRVVSFEWRGKGGTLRWRRFWTGANAVGSYGASLIWGIGLANLLQGLPLNSSGDFTGTFWDLFSPYTVLAGLAVVALFAFHGATFLMIRTVGDLHARAERAAARLSIVAIVLGAGFLAATIAVAIDKNDKSVFPPILPALIAAVALLAAAFLVRARSGWAFVLTALGTVAAVATLFTSLYPRVMVSDPNFGNSLTVSGAASAHYTLAVMSIVALIAMPGVLLYQGWTYHVFRRRVGAEEAQAERALRAVPEG